MLEIDTIQRKVRIAPKSIFCEVFTHPRSRPAFFMPQNRGGLARRSESWWGSEMNTAVTIAFYRWCHIGNLRTWRKDGVSNSFRLILNDKSYVLTEWKWLRYHKVSNKYIKK